MGPFQRPQDVGNSLPHSWYAIHRHLCCDERGPTRSCSRHIAVGFWCRDLDVGSSLKLLMSFAGTGINGSWMRKWRQLRCIRRPRGTETTLSRDAEPRVKLV